MPLDPCYNRLGQTYYMFGFIMLAFLVLQVACAQISILHCHFHLHSEDYRWWWRSFFSSGTTSFYVFLYCTSYFVRNTTITGALSYILYFGYTFIAVFLFFLMTGEEGQWVWSRGVASPVAFTCPQEVKVTIVIVESQGFMSLGDSYRRSGSSSYPIIDDLPLKPKSLYESLGLVQHIANF